MKKLFFKNLLLAQTASDAGKGYISSNSVAAEKAIRENYNLKDGYISQAIAAAEKLPFVEVSINHDSWLNMKVVLFNVKGYGQVSFHSFSSWKKYRKYFNKFEWNEIPGGSIMTCRKIARKFNLPWYEHHGKK